MSHATGFAPSSDVGESSVCFCLREDLEDLEDRGVVGLFFLELYLPLRLAELFLAELYLRSELGLSAPSTLPRGDCGGGMVANLRASAADGEPPLRLADSTWSLNSWL